MRTLPKIIHLQANGHVPSFKNSKQISVNRRTGRRFIRTDDRKKAWMEEATHNFASQLSCLSQTIGDETQMDHSQRFSTASLAQFDDSWQWVPQQTVLVLRCKKGEERAAVTLEMLQ